MDQVDAPTPQPSAMLPRHRVAAVWCVTFAILALTVRGAVPFFPFPMFLFEAPTKPTAMPLFLADGRYDRETNYERFTGVGPGDVDIRHEGYPCAAEHLLHEVALHLEQNQAPAGSPPGPVVIQIGLRIAHLGDDGVPVVRQRIDKTGYAWPAAR